LMGERLEVAGTVNSQARQEADFQRADLVDQRQLLVKARNSNCRPISVIYDRLLRTDWMTIETGPLGPRIRGATMRLRLLVRAAHTT
jgi:hypothetical protein